jgi:hypothetical protein
LINVPHRIQRADRMVQGKKDNASLLHGLDHLQIVMCSVPAH